MEQNKSNTLMWFSLSCVTTGAATLMAIKLIPNVNGRPTNFESDVFILLSVIIPTALIGGFFWYLGQVRKWKFIGTPANIGVITAITSILFNPSVWMLILATFIYLFTHISMVILAAILFGWIYHSAEAKED